MIINCLSPAISWKIWSSFCWLPFFLLFLFLIKISISILRLGHILNRFDRFLSCFFFFIIIFIQMTFTLSFLTSVVGVWEKWELSVDLKRSTDNKKQIHFIGRNWKQWNFHQNSHKTLPSWLTTQSFLFLEFVAKN